MRRPVKGPWEGNKVKHLSKNPLMKYVVNKFKNDVAKMLVNYNPKTILDVGCGEGFNTYVLGKVISDSKIEAIDLETVYIDYAKQNHQLPNIKYKVGDLYKLNNKTKYDFVMCNEVLEHLEDYEKALQMLCSLSSKYVLISAPNEPWFRVANVFRFKYLGQLGNTPGHLNNWTRKQLISLVSRYGKVLDCKTSSFWNLVLFEKY